jgi:hypothetical protein
MDALFRQRPPILTAQGFHPLSAIDAKDGRSSSR